MHCVSDTRYGNAIMTEKSPMARPYLFPAQLRRIVGERSVPTFVTVAVNHEERDWENNRWLSHEGVLKCFAASGFNLRDYYFDYLTGGCTNPDRFRTDAYPIDRPKSCRLRRWNGSITSWAHIISLERLSGGSSSLEWLGAHDPLK
jgi:hypothetical protein